MSLQRRILLLLAGVWCVFGLTVIAVGSGIVQPRFERLERLEARKDLTRCVQALHREVESLEVLCHDWSAWDDTYRFVRSRDEAYVAANLLDETFLDNELDLLAIYDESGRRIGGGGFDRALGLSMHTAGHFAQEMLRAGALGYIVKTCASEELVEAIRAVHEGKTYLSPEIAGDVVHELLGDPHRAPRTVRPRC